MTQIWQPPDDRQVEQLARQLKAQLRAKQTQSSIERKIKEKGKESALPYGQAIYSYSLEILAEALEISFEEFIQDPKKARVNGAAYPFFDSFDSTYHIAAVALVATLDQLSRKTRIATFCQNLGKAIEDETRLMRLNKKSPIEFRHLTRSGVSRRRIASKEVMKKLGCPVPMWTDLSRLHVGRFLLDHIAPVTGIVHVIKRRVGKSTPRFVIPTAEAERFIRECPSRNYKTTYTAMVCKPNPWNGLYGGGMLDNMEPLMRVPIQDNEEKHTTALDHYRIADMRLVFQAATHLQNTALRVVGDMVDLERTAWESGLAGLFPCARSPMEVPARLGDNPSADDLRARNRMAAMAHRDREQNRPRRVRIERSLQMAEELKDRTIYQSYHCDSRGRFYTSNKYVTTMGPDTEKALLNLDKPQPVDDTAMKWLLRAAAGHYKLSKSSWKEREKWGENNIKKISAIAQDPFGNLDLWRDADDPWQFLQLCKGVYQGLRDGESSAVIRFDQTTSGCGILSALVRDKKIGRLCNLWGDDRQDLYTQVAERVTERLVEDLQFGEDKEKALAELWLSRGIDRSLTKGPILASPYGGTYMSLCDSLVEALDEHLGYVPLEEFNFRVAMPAKYLARHLWSELKDEISSCLEVKKWLMKITRKIMQLYPVEYTMPSGWPMRFADREPTKRTVVTNLFGKKININIQDQPVNAKLSATQANKGVGANFVHGLDAAYLVMLMDKLYAPGIEVVVNHDCYGVAAIHADKFHKTLLETMNEFYQEDLLSQIHQEISEKTSLVLPKPPMVNTLDPVSIGTNPYLFS